MLVTCEDFLILCCCFSHCRWDRLSVGFEYCSDKTNQFETWPLGLDGLFKVVSDIMDQLGKQSTAWLSMQCVATLLYILFMYTHIFNNWQITFCPLNDTALPTDPQSWWNIFLLFWPHIWILNTWVPCWGAISSVGSAGVPCTEALSSLHWPGFESWPGAICRPPLTLSSLKLSYQ